MSNISIFKIFGLFTLSALLSCETLVDVKVNQVDPYLVVDAWLTHEPGAQEIKLTLTQPYFDNTFAQGVTDATVKVSDDQGNEFVFEGGENGKYFYTSADTFGVIGRGYFLEVQWQGHSYKASSRLSRGAEIDSIRYTYEPASGFGPEYYYTEFFGKDPVGEGDAFLLKAWRNGKFLNNPEEIYLFYDASFSAGNGDGIPFIFPIRTFPNPFESTINRNSIPPYSPADTIEIGDDGTIDLFNNTWIVTDEAIEVKATIDKPYAGGVSSYPLDGEPYSRVGQTIVKKADSVYLELHAITEEAWFFMLRLQQEINRPESFGALFATPPANVPTNIVTDADDVLVAGFFSIARVSSAGARLSDATILPEVILP